MRSPKRNETHLTKILAAWSALRPTASFGGLTLEQFKAAIQPSLDARSAMVEAMSQFTAAMVQRDNADAAALRIAEQVAAGVVANPQESNDGELYRAMGYVRKSERASGLTRKGVSANAAQPSAVSASVPVTKTA